MKAMTTSIWTPRSMVTLILDTGALLFIYFIPALVHYLSVPVYMIEPMRLMLILAIAHTHRYNALVLALTLPAFSFLVSGHPAFLKMLIITGELALNVAIFYLLVNRIRNFFATMFLSILLSKMACYAAYALVFSMAFVREEAAPLFLIVQLFTTAIFSIYISLTFKNRV